MIVNLDLYIVAWYYGSIKYRDFILQYVSMFAQSHMIGQFPNK